jgi:methyl-accepting chemotaxis protein
MMQHANTENEEERLRLRDQFLLAQDGFSLISSELNGELQAFPQIYRSLEGTSDAANELLVLAQEHFDIQDNRLAAREQSFIKNNFFEKKFNFFDSDFTDLIETARDENQKQLARDIKFVYEQSDTIKSAMQKILSVFDLTETEKSRDEFLRSIDLITKKAASIEENAPEIYEDIGYYVDILVPAVTEPSGVFQQHMLFVQLNKKSSDSLKQASDLMDRLSSILGASAITIREVSSSAQSEAEQTFMFSVMVNIALSVVSVLIALIVGYTVTRSIRVPMTIIIRALSHLAEGNLSHLIKEKFKSEMGLVSNKINKLTSQLSSLISEIQQSASTISKVAEESLILSESTNRNVADQRTQTDSVATAVTQMEVAIHEVATHATAASDEVSKVTDKATSSMDNMGKNLRFVNRLKDSLDQASDVIRDLSGESKQIGDILSVIQGIAEQTNLLALNAAIEAARAGEQGRGFAVVADEVRSLATRTQQSANEINDMIESLQKKAETAVSIVESNLEHADRSVIQTQETNDSLEEMVGSLSQVNEMSRSIASASVEQSSVAKDVAENIVHISDMAEKIASGAETAAENSKSLNDLSNKQSELVGRFKL